ncbi:unnamed protein product [Cunninghamella echinulata]
MKMYPSLLKNSKRLSKTIHMDYICDIPNFPVSKKEFSEAVECDEITLVYRNIKDVCETLFKSKPLWSFIKMGPEIATLNNEKVYNDTFTSNYWYDQHMEINKNHPGAMLLMLMLSSDQTFVSGHNKHKLWPIYLMLGNIPKII